MICTFIKNAKDAIIINYNVALWGILWYNYFM